MQETRISFLLNDLVREMNRQADGLLRKQFEITYSQFVFLLMIEETLDCDVTRLACSLGVTKGAVSKRLKWFIERDLVATHRLEKDEKRLMISLTKSGSHLTISAGNFLEKQFLTAVSNTLVTDESGFRNEIQRMLSLLQKKSMEN
jgi:DNA-binding MarR family transcriptional regulator